MGCNIGVDTFVCYRPKAEGFIEIENTNCYLLTDDKLGLDGYIYFYKPEYKKSIAAELIRRHFNNKTTAKNKAKYNENKAEKCEDEELWLKYLQKKENYEMSCLFSKLTINAFYGLLGQFGGVFNNLFLASFVTSQSRQALTNTIKFVKSISLDNNQEVATFGNTDSIHIVLSNIDQNMLI